MTQTILPVSLQDFTPTLPELPPRRLTRMGRIVQVILESKSKGKWYHTLILTITAIVSAILLVSIIFSPLVIYGVKEFVTQKERAKDDRFWGEVLNVAKENARVRYLQGRLGLFDYIEIPILPPEKRAQMIQRLGLSEGQTSNLSDRNLFLACAIKCPNFFDGCQITFPPPEEG